jgi:cytoskeleton-associated protein 5
LEDVKPALLTTLQAEFDKVADQRAPAPTRFVRSDAPRAGPGGDAGAAGGAGSAAAAASAAFVASSALDDLFPRVDLRQLVPAKLLTDMGDKDWKVREAAMTDALRLLEEVKRVQPQTGDLLPALRARLGDANKNLVIQALQALGVLATAMGKPIGKEYKAILPSILKGTPRCLFACGDAWGSLG